MSGNQYARETVHKSTNKQRKETTTMQNIKAAETSKKEHKLTPDDLIGAARALDAIEYLIQDLTEDFFDKYDRDEEKDRFFIAVEFNRHRGKMNAVQELFFSIQNTFKECGISCYN